jgi:hypothetical protein
LHKLIDFILKHTGGEGRVFAVTTKAGSDDEYLQSFTLSCSTDGTTFSDVLSTNTTTPHVSMKLKACYREAENAKD